MSRITEINNILFKQIKLMANHEDVKGKKLHDEVERSRTIATLAGQYISGEILEMKKQVMSSRVEKPEIAGYLTQD